MEKSVVPASRSQVEEVGRREIVLLAQIQVGGEITWHFFFFLKKRTPNIISN